MSYYLTQFGSVVFPITMPVTEMPTAQPVSGTVRTLGGAMDAWGSGMASPAFPVRVQYRVLVVDVVAASMLAKIDALRALGRKRDYLYRSGGGVITQRAAARLINVSATSTVKTSHAIEVTMDFELWSHWSTDWARGFTLDSGYYLDAGLDFDTLSLVTTLTTSPQTIVIANGGNVPVDDAVITVTAGSADITFLALVCGSAAWMFLGTIAAGTSVIVDAGAWSVTNNSVDAYASFAFDSTHAMDGIFRLEPGNNNVAIAHTGGGTGSTIGFDFADAWA